MYTSWCRVEYMDRRTTGTGEQEWPSRNVEQGIQRLEHRQDHPKQYIVSMYVAELHHHLKHAWAVL